MVDHLFFDKTVGSRETLRGGLLICISDERPHNAGLLFILFAIKNLKFIKKFSTNNVILLATIISFFLEVFPFRSTGSLYTSMNATYIILIGSVLISYRNLIKN